MKLAISILAACLFIASPVWSHPGRLNSEGCHHVRKDWVYKDGRTVKADTYHCHRPLGKLRLDGLEALQDPSDPGRPIEKAQHKQPATETNAYPEHEE